MYQELANKLYLAVNGSECTQAIDMAGYNAVCVEITVFTATSNVTVMIQCSNDGANWTDTTSTTSGTGPAYKMCAHTVFGQIASKYVRVKLTTNSTAAIVAVGINCTNIGA